MQVRTEIHKRLSIDMKEQLERYERCIDADGKRFFKLFRKSTFEGNQVAALEMTKIAKRQTKHNQEHLLLNSLLFLIRCDSKKLSWPNSPLLVMLQFVDPNMLSGGGTPLHHSADLADPFDYSTHKKQLTLAKQLIEHGANINAALSREGETPLHSACHGGCVTNLDFLEFLLTEGADPNAQDRDTGRTPLMYTIPHAPGAAKYLLNWPTTDANLTEHSGASFLHMVRSLIIIFSNEVARPHNPARVQHQLLLQQWIGIEEMLLERGAHDIGINQGVEFGANAWSFIFGGLAILICLFIGGYGMSRSLQPERGARNARIYVFFEYNTTVRSSVIVHKVVFLSGQ
jgi:hypothetical protein